MIHGQTKIELYNPSTRVRKVYRDENVFQGGNIAKWFSSLGDNDIRAAGNATFMTAPWKAMVGGILLFKDAITEGAQFMPAGNQMTGKGSSDIVNTGAPVELGSYNTSESSATGSGITQVYDFTTSQANGPISCVCLTSKEGGLVGYGNGSGQAYPGTKYNLGTYAKEIPLNVNENYKGIVAGNGKRYFVNGRNSDTKILIREQAALADPNHGSIFAGLPTIYEFDWSNYDERLRGESFYSFYYVGNNKIRIMRENYGTAAPGDTVYYLEYDTEAHTLTQKTFTNSSNRTLRISTNYYDSIKPLFTRDNKVVCQIYPYGTTFGGFIVFDLETSAVLYDSTDDGVLYDVRGFITIGPSLYMTGNKILDLQRETILQTDAEGLYYNAGGAYAHSTASGDLAEGFYQTGCGNQGNWISKSIALPMYLATINNLQTPVTKTAAQTMKITYTLTEA